MLNEWPDRDPGPRPPRERTFVMLAIIATLTLTAVAQGIWSLVTD